MKSPYHALLALRRAEEDAAGTALARAHRACQEARAALAVLEERRATWLGAPPGGAAGPPGPAAVVTELERAERRSRRDLGHAEEELEAARLEYLRRHRERQVVERLHRDWLARAEALAARRAQAELDDLAARGRSGEAARQR